MGNSWFQFQQFRINQDRCAMKISTDAILLGSLAKSENPEKILDIGTGTGVIALMLAQRFSEAMVTALEIDEDAATQASENFRESQFAPRLNLIHQRVQNFSSAEKYGLIVSNPPFFPDHLKSQDLKRNKALHADELSFLELAEKASKLLADKGSFWVILPPRQMKELEVLAARFGLFVCQKIKIRDNQTKPFHREISEFKFENLVQKTEELILKDEKSDYTGGYTALLSGFLLGYS